MYAQPLHTPVNLVNVINGSPARPAQACSRDYGFDYDEEEIVREMLAPLPIHISSQAIPEVTPHEFEQGFQCFLS